MRAKYGAVCVVGAVVVSYLVLPGGAQDVQGSRREPGEKFLKVGKVYMNPARIAFAARQGDQVVVVFGSNERFQVSIDGAEADALWKWLESRSEPVEGTSAAGDPSKKHASHTPTSPPVEKPAAVERRLLATGPQRLPETSGFVHTLPDPPAPRTSDAPGEKKTEPGAQAADEANLQEVKPPGGPAWGHNARFD